MTEPTRDVVRSWLDLCNEHVDRLTKWEQDFIASLTEQFDAGRTLTERQLEILERIYAAKTP